MRLRSKAEGLDKAESFIFVCGGCFFRVFAAFAAKLRVQSGGYYFRAKRLATQHAEMKWFRMDSEWCALRREEICC